MKQRSFLDARAYMHGLKPRLQSYPDAFFKWRVTDQRPPGIPSNPARVYQGAGWKGWPDYLGYESTRVRTQRLRVSYEVYSDYVRGLGLRNQSEFRVWQKTLRPPNFPSNPEKIYKGSGYLGMRDLLCD